MTDEEGFRVADLVTAAGLVLAILAEGEPLGKDDPEVAWLRKAADAARALLPEKD